jgi:hypothetical protein
MGKLAFGWRSSLYFDRFARKDQAIEDKPIGG